MDRPKLILVVGCPGSGKTRYLKDKEQAGELDVVLHDHIDDLAHWDKRIPKLQRLLRDGKRVGICGQSLRTRERRHLVQTLLRRDARSNIEYVFFEPDIRACLINIIKDKLKGKGAAYERACLVVAIADGAPYEIPADVERHPVFQQAVTEGEVEEFFRLEPQFSAHGQRRIREFLVI